MWEGLYCQIDSMNYIMYISDKWSILLLDLNCNFKFEVLEGIDPIITKIDHPWNKVLFLQTPLCH
jgi:hypothetical protein